MTPPDSRLLVVEDDAALRFLVTKQLSRIGHRADFARDGREALEKAKAACYDLILMDVMMPGMDGIEATRLLRASEAPGSCPRPTIVAMTAFADKQRCLEAGMDDFVFKPVMLEQLKAVLSRWLKEALPDQSA